MQSWIVWAFSVSAELWVSWLSVVGQQQQLGMRCLSLADSRQQLGLLLEYIQTAKISDTHPQAKIWIYDIT